MASVMPVTSVHAWAPAGSRPGDTVNVKSPHGQQLQAVIPVGVAAGQPFIVQVSFSCRYLPPQTSLLVGPGHS